MRKPSPTYEIVHADYRYLWDTYGEAADISGSYVQDYEWDEMLDNPTKATARRIMVSRIQYWFTVGPHPNLGSLEDALRDPEVLEIRKRHCTDFMVEDD